MASCVHASGESSPGNLSPGTYAVVLGIRTEQELLRLAQLLEAASEPVHRVVESHGQYAGQLMALGLRPGPKRQRGRLLSSIPLLRFTDFKEYRDLSDNQQIMQKILEREIAQFKHNAALPWWKRLFGQPGGE